MALQGFGEVERPFADIGRCHPRYLGVKAHAQLSRPDMFDGLRIHTDEIMEVIARISPSTLTIAIVSSCCRCKDRSQNGRRARWTVLIVR